MKNPSNHSRRVFHCWKLTHHGKVAMFGAPWLCISSACIFLWGLEVYLWLPIYFISLILSPAKGSDDTFDRNIGVVFYFVSLTVHGKVRLFTGAIFLTSVLAERFIVDQSVDNVTLKEIFSSSNVAQPSITILYCIIAPLLEETVYRRFLLASLVPSMKWYQAVLLSSGIFAAAHLSGQNFIQLFIVGGVLGCTYCWTGDLQSSILLNTVEFNLHFGETLNNE